MLWPFAGCVTVVVQPNGGYYVCYREVLPNINIFEILKAKELRIDSATVVMMRLMNSFRTISKSIRFVRSSCLRLFPATGHRVDMKMCAVAT